MAFKVSFSLGLLLGFILLSISPECRAAAPLWAPNETEIGEIATELKDFEKKNAGKEKAIDLGASCYGTGTINFGGTPFTIAPADRDKINKHVDTHLSKFCKSGKCEMDPAKDMYICVKGSGGGSGGGSSGSSSRQPIQLMTVLPGLFVVISVLLMDSFGLV